jgi:hypothetical protein
MNVYTAARIAVMLGGISIGNVDSVSYSDGGLPHGVAIIPPSEKPLPGEGNRLARRTAQAKARRRR